MMQIKNSKIFFGRVQVVIKIVFFIGFWLGALVYSQVFRGYYSNGTLEFESKKVKNRQIIRGYDSSGTLEFVASYRKGELDGIAREYYETGILKTEIPFKDNRRHGYAKFYYANGMLMGKIRYKRGRETGEAKFYDENGYLMSSSPKTKRRTRRSKRYEIKGKEIIDSLKSN